MNEPRQSDTANANKVIATSGYRSFDPNALIIGTIAEVTQQLLAFAKLSFTDVIVRNLHTQQDKALVLTRRTTVKQSLLKRVIHVSSNDAVNGL